MPAIIVGTAAIATQALIRRMSSFCCNDTWVRLASMAVVIEVGQGADAPHDPRSSSSASCSSSCTRGACRCGLVRVRRSSGSCSASTMTQELEDLALEVVEAPHRPAAGVGEDLLLRLEHVLLEAVEHRPVVVDDPAHDGGHHAGDARASRSFSSSPSSSRRTPSSGLAWP